MFMKVIGNAKVRADQSLEFFFVHWLILYATFCGDDIDLRPIYVKGFFDG